jgi:NhaP-type Na+/H+ or K+/H+ antiporter
VPRIQIDPDVIFLIVLPPLLYIAAYFTPIRSLRDNLGTSSLAVGLVIVSAAAVAVGAHALIPRLPWSAAFALGAIVAPPEEEGLARQQLLEAATRSHRRAPPLRARRAAA